MAADHDDRPKLDDPTNDATLPWPEGRQQIDAGTITIDGSFGARTGGGAATAVKLTNPLVLPSGIEPSDDPLLSGPLGGLWRAPSRCVPKRETRSQRRKVQGGKFMTPPGHASRPASRLLPLDDGADDRGRCCSSAWGMAASVLRTLTIFLVSIHRPLGVAIFVLCVIRIRKTGSSIRRRSCPIRFYPCSVWLPRHRTIVLYALMLIMPLVGWGMFVGGAPIPILLYGPLRLPPILPHDLDALCLGSATSTLSSPICSSRPSSRIFGAAAFSMA